MRYSSKLSKLHRNNNKVTNTLNVITIDETNIPKELKLIDGKLITEGKEYTLDDLNNPNQQSSDINDGMFTTQSFGLCEWVTSTVCG